MAKSYIVSNNFIPLNRMRNLGEYKSRQFHRHSSIQPIVKAPSLHNFDSRKNYPSKLIFQRSPYAENNYNLANIVNDILQLKPNTASKRPTPSNTKNNKTEFNSIHKQSIQFYSNYGQPDKYSRAIQQTQQNDQVSFKYKEASLLNKQYKLLYIPNELKEEKRLLKQSNKKAEKEQYPSKEQFQTIKFPEEKIHSKSKVQFEKKHNKEMFGENRCEQNMKNRRNSQYVLLPKTKLSVRTIEPLIKIKSQQIRNKSSKHIKNDVQNNESDSNNNANGKISEEKIFSGRKLNKIKRSVTDARVPDFIKMSLEGYYEPEFKIKELAIKKNEIEQQRHQPEVSIDQDIAILAQIRTNNKSQENLAGIKVKLQTKERKRTLKTSEQVVSEREQNLVEAEQVVVKTRKRKSVSQHRRIYVEEDHDICGWESNGQLLQDSLNFKQ